MVIGLGLGLQLRLGVRKDVEISVRQHAVYAGTWKMGTCMGGEPYVCSTASKYYREVLLGRTD